MNFNYWNKNSLKNKIINNKVTFGSWISLGDFQFTEIMANAGFDWIVIDLEHTSIDFNETLQLIRIIESASCIPLVRVGANDELIIKRVLDSGAHGIIIPQINTRLDAERAVNSIYYPPFGQRGTGLSRAQGYGGKFFEYIEWAKENLICIVQIEHIDAVNNIESIMAVKGVDGFLIGPYDLSSSLNIPGKWHEKEYVNAITKVEDYMINSNKIGGIHIVQPNLQEFKRAKQKGYKFIAYASDMIFFNSVINKEIENIKNLAEEDYDV